MILINVLARLEKNWLPYKEKAPISKSRSFFQIRHSKCHKFCMLKVTILVVTVHHCRKITWKITQHNSKVLNLESGEFVFHFNSQPILLVYDGLKIPNCLSLITFFLDNFLFLNSCVSNVNCINSSGFRFFSCCRCLRQKSTN